jgi:DNA-binding NarL/FixJ family response regulator
MVAANHPRVLIADDHTLVAEAVKNLLVREFDVVGVVADGRALVEAALQLEPDLVLADIAMPTLNGLDAAQRIKHALPGTKIIFLTMLDDPDILDEAFRKGGSAVVSKTSPYSELVRIIRRVLSDGLHIVHRARPRDDGEIGTAVAGLTDRQRDVLQLLAEGLSMKEVARILNLTTRTVIFHKYRVMQRLGVHNDAELVRCAIDKHLLFVSAPVEMHTSIGDGILEDRERRGNVPDRAVRAA